MSTLNHHHEPGPTRLLPEVLDLIAAELYHSARAYRDLTSTPSVRSLSYRDCSACSLVCKEFQAIFHPFVFRELKLPYADLLQKFATLLRNSPHIGAYVSILEVGSSWSWEDWEEDFLIVARQVVNLQHVSLRIQRPYQQPALPPPGLNDVFRRAITCILSYPSICSMVIFGDIVFAISPRLLLASLDRIFVDADYRPDAHDLVYWENLNTAYLTLLDPSAAKELLEAPIKCRSLTYCWDDVPSVTPVWLSYIMAVQPATFANLTTLDMTDTCDQHSVQTVLALAGAGLQILRVSLAYLEKEEYCCHLPLNLSHNTSLQVLGLYYDEAYASMRRTNPMPQMGLSVVETSLKTVNAPSLRDVCIIVKQLECCGGQSFHQSPHLQRLDAYFSDFSQCHPHVGHLELSIHFKHYPSCKDNIVTCNWSPLNSSADHQNALKGHFPFLTTEKPAHLEVVLGFDLEYKPLSE